MIPLRRPTLLLAFVLVAAACGDSGAATTAPPQVTTTSPPATTGPLPRPEASTTTTMADPGRPDPLTNRAIAQDELMLMTLDNTDLIGLFVGFFVDQRLIETNEELVRKSVLDSEDEAADVAAFGREAGARAIFRRAGPDDQGIENLHVAVSLFADDAGASAYLEDWFLDAAKSVGGGHPAPLRVTGIERLDAPNLGAEALAVRLEETAPGSAEPTLFETLIVFRVGRLLAWTSLLVIDDTDVQVSAFRLAEVLETRVLGVLRGNIRLPDPEPPAEVLAGYAFRFEQNVFRPFSRVESVAEGVVVLPDSVQCDVTITVDGFPELKQYVKIGNRAWYDLPLDLIAGFSAIDPNTDFVATDLLFCPGWPILAADGGLGEEVLRGETAERVEVDGRAARLYVLGQEQAVASGLLPEESGIAVERFLVRIDVAEPWLLGLEVDLRGRAPAFVAVFGEEFEGAATDTYRMEIRFEATRVNAADLAVTAP